MSRPIGRARDQCGKTAPPPLPPRPSKDTSSLGEHSSSGISAKSSYVSLSVVAVENKQFLPPKPAVPKMKKLRPSVQIGEAPPSFVPKRARSFLRPEGMSQLSALSSGTIPNKSDRRHDAVGLLSRSLLKSASAVFVQNEPPPPNSLKDYTNDQLHVGPPRKDDNSIGNLSSSGMRGCHTQDADDSSNPSGNSSAKDDSVIRLLGRSSISTSRAAVLLSQSRDSLSRRASALFVREDAPQYSLEDVEKARSQQRKSEAGGGVGNEDPQMGVTSPESLENIGTSAGSLSSPASETSEDREMTNGGPSDSVRSHEAPPATRSLNRPSVSTSRAAAILSQSRDSFSRRASALFVREDAPPQYSLEDVEKARLQQGRSESGEKAGNVDADGGTDAYLEVLSPEPGGSKS